MKTVVIEKLPINVVSVDKACLSKTYLVTFLHNESIGYIQKADYYSNGWRVMAFRNIVQANGWTQYSVDDMTLEEYIKYLITKCSATVMEFDKEVDALKYVIKQGIK